MTAPKHTPGPWFVRNQADIMTANGAARRDGERAAENDAWNVERQMAAEQEAVL